MKERILALKAEGKTYNEIKAILNCSKGTISYHCGKGQKEKSRIRTEKSRLVNPLIRKTETFQNKKLKNNTENIRKFQKRDNQSKGNVNKFIPKSFTWRDVVDKFGEDTFCYLSGEKINLYENNYHFDHVVPSSKGGDNTIDNLGILHKDVNYMKSDLTKEELLIWCKKILEFNDYTVSINT